MFAETFRMLKSLRKMCFSIILFQDPVFVDRHIAPHRRFPSKVIESRIAIGGNRLQHSVQTAVVTEPLVGQRQYMCIFWAGPSKLIGST